MSKRTFIFYFLFLKKISSYKNITPLVQPISTNKKNDESPLLNLSSTKKQLVNINTFKNVASQENNAVARMPATTQKTKSNKNKLLGKNKYNNDSDNSLYDSSEEEIQKKVGRNMFLEDLDDYSDFDQKLPAKNINPLVRELSRSEKEEQLQMQQLEKDREKKRLADMIILTGEFSIKKDYVDDDSFSQENDIESILENNENIIVDNNTIINNETTMSSLMVADIPPPIITVVHSSNTIIDNKFEDYFI
jgi:hypothetical protein